MKFVIVNGKLAVDNGTYNGALAGRALRKQTSVTEPLAVASGAIARASASV